MNFPRFETPISRINVVGTSSSGKSTFIWWTITTHSKVRRKYENCLNNLAYKHIQFVRLRNHTEAEAFIEFCTNNLTTFFKQK